MPLAVILCGPPGAGKSTWYVDNVSHFPSFFYASTDEWINAHAQRLGKTYTEVFDEHYPDAEKQYHSIISAAQSGDYSLVVDRTHTTEASRKRILKLINPKYKKIAVYFPCYTPERLHSRIQERVAKGGHDVDMKYIEEAHLRFKIPTYTEGFDLVISASEFERIFKVMKFND